MATYVQSIRTMRRPFVIPIWRLNIFWRMRKDLFAGRLLLSFGFILPTLMILELIPASLWLGFLALGLLGLGGLTLLVCCGEIA